MKNYKIGEILIPFLSYYMLFNNIEEIPPFTTVILFESSLSPNDYLLYYKEKKLGFINKYQVRITG